MDMVQRCRYRAIVKTCGWKILIRPLDVDVRGPLAWELTSLEPRTSNIAPARTLLMLVVSTASQVRGELLTARIR